LVIAHRLSTVQSADLICVVDRGHVVEMGRHAELIVRDGLYARLHAMEFVEGRGLAEAAPAAVPV
jgi:subfamily B ATP-binding cassette protein MsbA